MAAGLPVISTKIGVAGLNVTNGKNVLIADGVDEIISKAQSLLEDEKLARLIGMNGQKHVRKYFDWKSIVKMHEPIYQKLVRSKNK